METIVLSGPTTEAARARQVLSQKGLRVEMSLDHVRSNRGPQPKRDYNHGFDQEDGEAFVTCWGDVDDWQVVEPLGYRLRMHWSTGTEGEWENQKSRDPFKELDELRALLRAANVPGA